MLYNVLRVDSELVSFRLRLGDGLLESAGPLAGGLQDKQVGLASGKHPLLVLTDIDRLDGLAEPWKERLCNLAHLLVHTDVTVGAAHREAPIQRRADRVEEDVRLVGLRGDNGVAAAPWIKLVHSLGLHTDEGTSCFLLTVLGIIGDAVEVDTICAELLEDLTSL